MPNNIDEKIEQTFGPVTLQRMRSIKQNVEDLGRALGIPEEQQLLTAKIIEIEHAQRLAERIDEFRADSARWHAEEEAKEKKKFDWSRFIRNLASSFVGEYDARNKK